MAVYLKCKETLAFPSAVALHGIPVWIQVFFREQCCVVWSCNLGDKNVHGAGFHSQMAGGTGVGEEQFLVYSCHKTAGTEELVVQCLFLVQGTAPCLVAGVEIVAYALAPLPYGGDEHDLAVRAPSFLYLHQPVVAGHMSVGTDEQYPRVGGCTHAQVNGQALTAYVAGTGGEREVSEVRVRLLQGFEQVWSLVLAVHVHHHNIIVRALLCEQGREMKCQFVVLLVGYDEKACHRRSSVMYPIGRLRQLYPEAIISP